MRSIEVVGSDRGDDAMHVVMHAAMVDLRLDNVDAEIGCGAHGLGALARGKQRLGWHAAVVQTVAAHAALLDQHHRHPELGSRCRDRKAP